MSQSKRLTGYTDRFFLKGFLLVQMLRCSIGTLRSPREQLAIVF